MSDPEYHIHAELSPEEAAAYQRSKRTSRQEYINRVKNQPCMDCGGSFPPEAMDFDHVRGEKDFVIGGHITGSWKKLQEEITKCDVVCSNCHRIRTHQRLRGT